MKSKHKEEHVKIKIHVLMAMFYEFYESYGAMRRWNVHFGGSTFYVGICAMVVGVEAPTTSPGNPVGQQSHTNIWSMDIA